MPKATVEEARTYTLPADEPLPAILKSVEEREKFYNDKKTGERKSFWKWNWTFQITDGEYAGLHAYVETDPKVTMRDDDKPRQWAETLMDMPLNLGDGLDTDLLIGLPCCVVCEHREPFVKKDGSLYYDNPVRDVLPEGAAGPKNPGQSEEPPF